MGFPKNRQLTFMHSMKKEKVEKAQTSGKIWSEAISLYCVILGYNPSI